MIKWCMLSEYFLFKCSLQQKAKVTHSRNQYLVRFYLISRNISDGKVNEACSEGIKYVYVILATHPHS